MSQGKIIIVTEQSNLNFPIPLFLDRLPERTQRHCHEIAIKTNPGDPWVGLYTLPTKSHTADLPWTDIIANRMTAVSQCLSASPYVFIAGKTGVGKSTFVQDVWAKTHPNIHFGESAIKAWAMDHRDGIKTLFIDEANISSRQWSEFEGLFKEPRTILTANELIPVSPEHKLIFAGNPLSYGGERQLPSLFERHGNSILFEPLSTDFLYHNGLQSILAQCSMQPEETAKPILMVADFLTHISPDEVLISPRELKQMALSTLANVKKYSQQDSLHVARYFAYTYGKRLVPTALMPQFESLWESQPQLANVALTAPAEIALNASNQAAYEALTDAINVRELRLQTPETYLGGISGIVIEGEPGLGKSDLVLKTLKALHFIENQDFYYLTAGSALSEKYKILEKAFNQGAIVIADEINSSVMMERELNELLSGYYKGKLATRAGFLLIGTQNPPTLNCRVRASLALQRRLNQVTIPAYTRHELIEILRTKGLPESISTDMVDEYILIKSFNVSFCCRNLIQRAQQEILMLSSHAPTSLTDDLTEDRVDNPNKRHNDSLQPYGYERFFSGTSSSSSSCLAAAPEEDLSVKKGRYEDTTHNCLPAADEQDAAADSTSLVKPLR